MKLARRLIEPDLITLKKILLILKVDVVAKVEIYKKIMEHWEEVFEQEKPALKEKISD